MTDSFEEVEMPIIWCLRKDQCNKRRKQKLGAALIDRAGKDETKSGSDENQMTIGKKSQNTNLKKYHGSLNKIDYPSGQSE